MLVLAIVLSLIIGVSLGLLGGGGSILTVPILVYVLGVEPKEAIATSLVVVGVTSFAGMLPHARANNVRWKTGLIFGAAGMIGAFGGGFVAAWIPATVLLGLFALLMIATAVAMLRGRKNVEAHDGHGSPWKIVLDGLVVGAVTGLVGAGGGFLVVPALALLGGLPMRQAVGTSLLVIAMKSFAGYLGHASHVEIDWALTGIVSASAVAGSFVGARLTSLVPPDKLRRGFAYFVLAMAVYLVVKQGSDLAKAEPEAEAAEHAAVGPAGH